MSRVFGPVLQQGYVVPDVHAAIHHWLDRGVGPFFVEKLEDYPAIVDGQELLVNLTAAFAYSGDQQYADRHAYIDNVRSPGVMIQLMARGDVIDELFEIVRSGAETWDGITRPVRKIDWSTGRPVEVLE